MTSELGPVLIEQVRGCHYKDKPCKVCGMGKGHKNHTPRGSADHPFGRSIGCARCGRAKKDPIHFGAPASFNVLASGEGSGNAMAYFTLKRQWEDIFTSLLRASPLPRGLGGVYVDGEITFPDRRMDRDQGNFRVVIEKALGDALQKGGWIERDDWTRYEFGQLTMRIQEGESATRLTIFPRPADQPHPATIDPQTAMELHAS